MRLCLIALLKVFAAQHDINSAMYSANIHVFCVLKLHPTDFLTMRNLKKF